MLVFMGLAISIDSIEMVVSLLAGCAALLGISFWAGRLTERIWHPKVHELERQLANSETSLAKKTRYHQNARRKLNEERDITQKYKDLRDALFGEEDELWKLYPAQPPNKKYFETLENSRAKAIMVGNFKGGVGKTTLVANLAAYFEQRLDKRVLVVDLDYQGSLTQVLIGAAQFEKEGRTYNKTLALDFLEAEKNYHDLAQMVLPLGPAFSKTDAITADYPLVRLENRLMMKWLFGEAENDVRYNMGRILLDDAFQTKYDIILFDIPPRMTAATLNALCASHYYIVPTIPDKLSAVAVGRYCKHIEDLKAQLNPKLSFRGVVLNLTQQKTLVARERDAFPAFTKELLDLGLDPYICEHIIPRSPQLATVAGQDVLYLKNKLFRETIMDPLGDEIARRIGLSVPAESQAQGMAS